MSTQVGALLGMLVLLLVGTFGWAINQIQGSEAALARAAEVGVEAMQVEGGYTSQVQQAVAQDLQQAGFNPADVNILPS
ncbi:MAG: hypothetical protein OWV35_05750, partial [Firmicutes bacterium]|nr:hypothetical protein [Bacillota bacterium]